MVYYRKVYETAPESVIIPDELRNQRVEVLILPLEKILAHNRTEQPGDQLLDANGWPLDFFENTYGSLPDLPERSPQGGYDLREELL